MRAGVDLLIWIYLDSHGSAKADPNGEKLERGIHIGLTLHPVMRNYQGLLDSYLCSSRIEHVDGLHLQLWITAGCAV